MKNRNTSFALAVVFSLLGLVNATAQQRQLSLSDAIRIGLEQNHDVKIAIFKAKAVGNAHVDEIQANRLPSLKLYGSYTRLSDITATPIAIPIPGIPPFAFKTYLPDNYSLKLSLFQPIFTGFRLSNLQQAAEHTRDAALEDIKTVKNGLVFQIKQQYWTLYKLQKTLEAVNKSLVEANAHLTDVKSNLSKGTALPNDTLKTQVQVSTTELRKMQIEKDIHVAMAALLNTLGLPIGDAVDLTTQPDNATADSRSLDALIHQAQSKRTELSALDERVEAAKATIGVAKSAAYPQISASGDVIYADPNSRYFPVENSFKATWDVSLNLTWDLWTWNVAGLQAEQAEYNMQQLQESRKATEDAIQFEVTQNYLAQQTSFAQIQVAKLSVTQAQENLRIVNLQYQKGVANTTDVIDAETAALQADINVATAISDANIATAQLQKSIGE